MIFRCSCTILSRIAKTEHNIAGQLPSEKIRHGEEGFFEAFSCRDLFVRCIYINRNNTFAMRAEWNRRTLTDRKLSFRKCKEADA